MNPENIQDLYTLTPTQRAILFHTLYAPETGVYVEQNAVEIHDLDVACFIQAWQQVIQRHAALRTAFFWEEVEEPLQVVAKELSLPLTQLDWRGLDDTQQMTQLEDLMAAERQQGFALSVPPLFRLYLMQLDENRHFFLINFHHILYDGWSNIVVHWESNILYDAYRRGETAVLPDSTPFREYISWLKQQEDTTAQTYWKEYLAGFIEATPIPIGETWTQGVYGAIAEYAEQRISLPTDVGQQLQLLLAQENITYNNFMQAIWGILLNRYSGEDDILFGTVIHGRPTDLPHFDRMVGLFINVLPVRLQFEKKESVLSYLKRSHNAFLAQAQFSHNSLEQIQKWGGFSRERNLFHSLFINNNPPIQNESSPRDDIKQLFVREKTNFPLNFYLKSEEVLQISYDPTLFSTDTIGRMLDHVIQVIQNILADPTQMMESLTILPINERNFLLKSWNNAPSVKPAGSLVADFIAQVKKSPDAIAVVDPGYGTLTYAELDKQSTHLAHHLHEAGFRNGRIGLHMHRSHYFPVCFWGILKSGNSYVPLEPKHPSQRLTYMIDNAQLDAVITHTTLQDSLRDVKRPLFSIDALSSPTAKDAFDLDDAVLTETAVILYTSGSTGQPKGVRLSHKGLYSYTHTAIKQFNLCPTDHVLQFASIGFDTSLEEMCPIHLTGGTLVLRTEESLSSIQTFFAFCHAHQITVLDLPTAFWHTLTIEMQRDPNLQLPPDIHTIIIGGEKASPEHLATWQTIVSDEVVVLNTYGPTETTIVTVACPLTGADAVVRAELAPIGVPVASARVYVVDQYKQLAAIGVPGELLLGGPQVALGYVGLEAETAVKFIPDPFGEDSIVYRTGDRVRFLEEGILQFVGRTDRQVKIRGHRIEPETIEHLLNQHEAVSETAVVIRSDILDNPQIVAYLIPQNGSLPDKQSLTAYLRQQLPAYMLPAAFVTVTDFPKTNNGKINYQALPIPTFQSQTTDQYIAPDTPIEEAVANLFSDLTNVAQIGLYDNFFQLGGHSLLITQLSSRIQTLFEVELSLRALFENPTVIDMAILIEEKMLEMLEALDEDEINLLL